ncbi:MAG TPA: site-specific DNA-methyltransferase [Anaerolineales bacterium]|nr:site-specific DNA-methyltransferase [Anaerolineales bacterium]
MPSLNWIGKSAVVAHHKQVPFRLLKCRADLSVGDPQSGNLLVQGDNLEALKALLPYYAGQVKCIYIDPPYNTGNEGWVYNDAMNSPEMRDWLGKVVGGESEDLSRHDKWLCMMYPRLALLREFLSEDGVLFVSIDDTEVHLLRALLDEIFGLSNWICTLIWKRRQTPDSRNLNGVSADHEYLLCYGRGKQIRFKGQSKDLSKYTNPDNDPNGSWMSDNLTGLANKTERPNLHYSIVHPVTGQRYLPHPSRGWIYGQERMAELIATNRILWPKSPNGRPRLKRYLFDMKSETTGFSTLLDASGNVVGTKELAQLLGPKAFAFPKPSELIQILIEQATDRDSIVLDSFAGSGTTGHAVLKQNARDGGKRRFILVELDANIAPNITAERLKRVAQGYTYRDQKGNEKFEPGLGGGFRFCELGATLFDAGGQIRPEVAYDDLAQHIFFIETGSPLPHSEQPRYPLLGVHNGTAVYLLYNGVLKDKSPQGGNMLTLPLLATLPEHFGPKIIYGNGCRIGEHRLRELSIVFKQIPYEIRER